MCFGEAHVMDKMFEARIQLRFRKTPDKQDDSKYQTPPDAVQLVMTNSSRPRQDSDVFSRFITVDLIEIVCKVVGNSGV